MVEIFFIAVAFTLGVSALCSLLEAMLLSTRHIEVEKLSRTHPRAGTLLRRCRDDMEGTIAAILTVNTVTNTLGSILIGVIGAKAFGEWWLGVISALMTIGILFLSEILPKNIGVLYRNALQPVFAFPLYGIYLLAGPLTNFASWLIRKILRRPKEAPRTEEITMLAEKEMAAGRLSPGQFRLIQSALALDATRVGAVMTPRKVVETADADETVEDFLKRAGRVRFGRIPVTESIPDNVIGVVRRKDLLHAVLEGNGKKALRDLMKPPVFVPEVGTLSKAMELLVAQHQPLAVVVDEFGGFAGVVSLEDLFEFFIGNEFYETDDVAVDMQELAMRKFRSSPTARDMQKQVELVEKIEKDSKA
jgi:CBS domain containing-hemolysin-like protein